MRIGIVLALCVALFAPATLAQSGRKSPEKARKDQPAKPGEPAPQAPGEPAPPLSLALIASGGGQKIDVPIALEKIPVRNN